MIKYIVLTILILAALQYFGYDVKGWIVYITQFVMSLWDTIRTTVKA